MKAKNEAVKKVEALQHFPFQSFDECREAEREGIIRLGIDRLVAFNLAKKGVYLSKLQIFNINILIAIPYLMNRSSIS